MGVAVELAVGVVVGDMVAVLVKVGEAVGSGVAVLVAVGEAVGDMAAVLVAVGEAVGDGVGVLVAAGEASSMLVLVAGGVPVNPDAVVVAVGVLGAAFGLATVEIVSVLTTAGEPVAGGASSAHTCGAQRIKMSATPIPSASAITSAEVGG